MKQPSMKTRVLMCFVTGAIYVLIGAAGTIRHGSMGVFNLILGVFWIGIGFYARATAAHAKVSLSLRGDERD